MSERTLKAGSGMFFGVPASPMPDVITEAIGQAVAQVPGIHEAYLPQCVIEGESEARQVLVVGVARKSQIPAIMEDLTGKMRLVLPEGQFIDIFPFQCSLMPSAARVAECAIFKTSTQDEQLPWWRFW